MKSLIVSLVVFMLGVHTDTGAVDPHLVHFGDIKLEPCTDASFCKTDTSVVGTVLVYYGTSYRASEWRPVCRDSFSDDNRKGSDAICNMLGYETGEQYEYSFDPNVPHFISSTDFALTFLDCTAPQSNGAPPNHLLRCKSTPYISGSSSCSGALLLKCSNPKGYPLTNSEHAYDGQVELCPPDQLSNDTNPALQVSMGIVSVLENSYWGSLNQNDSSSIVTRQQADSICRQLGFTGAVLNSVRTVNSYLQNYTFSKCQFPADYSPYGLQRVWLRVSQSQYCDSSSPCFSCCYQHPLDGGQCRMGTLSNGHCSKDHCCIENDVVLECTFDQSVSLVPESGSAHICSFGTASQTSLSSGVCAQEKVFTMGQLLAGIFIPTILLLSILVICCCIWKLCLPKRKRDVYELLQSREQSWCF